VFDFYGLKNSREILSSINQSYQQSEAGAACNVGYDLCANMAEGSDSALEIFQPSKRTKSEVWSYFGFYKSPEGNLIKDGHPVCRTCNKNTNIFAAKEGKTPNLESSS
jgi:hypothetical protein